MSIRWASLSVAGTESPARGSVEGTDLSDAAAFSSSASSASSAPPQTSSPPTSGTSDLDPPSTPSLRSHRTTPAPGPVVTASQSSLSSSPLPLWRSPSAASLGITAKYPFSSSCFLNSNPSPLRSPRPVAPSCTRSRSTKASISSLANLPKACFSLWDLASFSLFSFSFFCALAALSSSRFLFRCSFSRSARAFLNSRSSSLSRFFLSCSRSFASRSMLRSSAERFRPPDPPPPPPPPLAREGAADEDTAEERDEVRERDDDANADADARAPADVELFLMLIGLDVADDAFLLKTGLRNSKSSSSESEESESSMFVAPTLPLWRSSAPPRGFVAAASSFDFPAPSTTAISTEDSSSPSSSRERSSTAPASSDLEESSDPPPYDEDAAFVSTVDRAPSLGRFR
mmetsp:Transcript_1292/g.3513  ORF Transcript_1292/g.3513 Transcript_1292/m.3513 type:complete len:402 (+) Transcript_1292:672-1877(+)